jgi:protein-S-isoprenylcysteine O-methyltransferase Ste14
MNQEIERIFIAAFIALFGLVIGIPMVQQAGKPITIHKAVSPLNRLMELGLLIGLGAWVWWFSCFTVFGRSGDMFNLFGGLYNVGDAQAALTLVGAALMSIGLGVISLGIREMKHEWRIGIDEKEPQTELVTTGIFAVMRHPIYTGIIFITLGGLAVLPHLLTLVLTLLSIAGTVAQMKLEEHHLRKRFGTSYINSNIGHGGKRP